MKTFGRRDYEVTRYREINGKVRDIGVRRALVGRWFFMGISIVARWGRRWSTGWVVTSSSRG
ncbi:MAG: hypothetical protein R2856_09300 [Caldilineaceae bacterium]